MIHNLRTNKVLWSITTLLALISSTAGVINTHVYDGVFPKEFIPGAFPQDMLSIVICLLAFFLIYRAKEKSYKIQIILMGIIGSFFYLYGIFTIERVYNMLYLVYAAIFAMSFWSLLYSLMSINYRAIQKIKVSKTLRYTSVAIAICIAVLFVFLWTSALIPLMRTHNRIEFLYSIYILDLCFIMPAFFITSILTLRNRPIGILLLPAVFIVGFFVIFPLGLGELAKPFYGQVTNVGSMIMSFVLAATMLVIGLLHLFKCRTPED